MQRDKRGRFVKKADGGTNLNKLIDGTIIDIGGVKYKVKNGAQRAFDQYKADFEAGKINVKESPTEYDAMSWVKELGKNDYLEPYTETPTTQSLNTSTPINTTFNPSVLGIQPFKAQELKVPDPFDPFGLKAKKESVKNWQLMGLPEDSPLAPEKLKYNIVNGKTIDESGREINPLTVYNNKDLYQMDMGLEEYVPEDDSAGMNLKDVKDPLKQYESQNKPIDKTKLADFLELTRAGIGASVNNKIAKRALAAEKPFLQDVSESHRAIYGDYRAQVQGEKAAAQLRNMASKPLTSDGALQSHMMMEAQLKGQQYIDQGNAQDEAMIKQTREVAWQQEKENQQQRQAVAMQNKQAMLMSEKNKAQIKNMRDSANFSQVVSPLLAAKEQRIRNKAAQQEYYQDYYNDATIAQNVWNTYEEGLSDSQKVLRNEYLTGGTEGLQKYIGNDETRYKDYLQLQQIMNNEIIRRKAALKGAYINPAGLPGTQSVSTNPYAMWENPISFNKKGGTVYKAKLSKRTKDNDRGAKSIETSKKIAARFLEQAIDSLYSYDDVELIAKPKKRKRKYQAGGGLPFVNFTPVFATSEVGAPKADSKASKNKDDKDDLTSKDVLQLLKDMDGLPADMQVIVSSLKNFELQDKMDPLGLSSSSDIASRYISLINKIKVAKFNRDEYNNAFNQLKGNGGLNEYAITSEGYLIGTNQDGDFQMFTPDEVNAGTPRKQGYSLLTNSNLLHLRANSLDAAFNHKLTTFAQNGIGMEVITEQVNKIIQGLGSSKESEEGFVQMGQKGQIKQGLEYLRKVAREVGDSSINQNMSVADYYQAGYLTEDQANQAELALHYLWSSLPANARSLLQVKGGSSKGAEALLKSLVFSRTSTDTQFKATPKKMSKESSGSSSSGDGVDELKLSPVQMMQVGYTDHMPVTLQKGTKYATRVNAQVLPITDVNKKLLGVTTLDKVAESTFGGALDMNNVTMGSQLIDPQALQNVQIDSTNLYVMNLPIDKNSPDGTIKPDLSWMTKIEAIDETIREQGITDVAQINKLYTDAGLPVLMDDNGQLNIQDYCKFGVLNGHALNSAFKELDLLDNTVNEIDDEDQITNILSILNKGRNEKDRIDFDSKSWADSIFGTDHDSIYEGTIYIPVRTNAFTGMIGGGQYPDTQTAAEVEALIQQKERTRGYVDPGLLIN